MSQQQENRSKWIKVRLKPSELDSLEGRQLKTTFQNVSEFARAMLLGQPVTVRHRDNSMDQILEELVLLRKELNAIGNNLNQLTKRLHSAHGGADQQLWLGLIAVINGKLNPQMQQVKERINQFAELWLQKLRAAKA